MSLLAVVAISAAVLIAAYFTYGRFLSRFLALDSLLGDTRLLEPVGPDRQREVRVAILEHPGQQVVATVLLTHPVEVGLQSVLLDPGPEVGHRCT